MRAGKYACFMQMYVYCSCSNPEQWQIMWYVLIEHSVLCYCMFSMLWSGLECSCQSFSLVFVSYWLLVSHRCHMKHSPYIQDLDHTISVPVLLQTTTWCQKTELQSDLPDVCASVLTELALKLTANCNQPAQTLRCSSRQPLIVTGRLTVVCQ